ncbi:hypothetical protein, partial [Escherichia coli]|uniref:hypothetical protein n=2 Tax=Pseudomonadota TaxID=1224 RepID=UPI003CE6CC26
VTPSYNSTANVGAMLVLAGVAILWRTERRPAAGAARVVIAVGLCAAAFAKPPLFALACVLLILLAGGSLRHHRRRSGDLLVALALTPLL